jgi:hypothetical protein
MPPKAVRKPSEAFMPRMSSGLVSWRASGRVVFFADDARPPGHRVVGEEDHPAAGGARASREPAGEQPAALHRLGLLPRVEDRPQEVVERLGLDPQQRLLAGDEPLLRHLHGDARGGQPGALASAGLQHVEGAPLDGELDVLHLAIVLLQLLAHRQQLARERRPARLHLGHLLRRADAGHHVLALGVHQELAVELVLARGRAAREGHARAGVLAQVPVDHGLHGDGGPPAGRDPVELAVGDGPVVLPGVEDRPHRQEELLVGIGRQVDPLARADDLLERGHQLAQRLDRQLGVVLQAERRLLLVEDLLEGIAVLLGLRLHPQHHVAEHGAEAAVAVPGEARVAAPFRQPLHRLVVEAEVEDGVHHARHGDARAGADRHEERILAPAEALAGELLHPSQGGAELRLQPPGHPVAALVPQPAHVGGDGEAGRHRDADGAHLGEPRPLATEQVLQVAVALGRAAAEGVDALDHGRPRCPTATGDPAAGIGRSLPPFRWAGQGCGAGSQARPPGLPRPAYP